MNITQKDLNWYNKTVAKGKQDRIFNLYIVSSVIQFLETYKIVIEDSFNTNSNEVILDIANIAYDCYLKAEEDISIDQIIDRIIINYKEIILQGYSPRTILSKFFE